MELAKTENIYLKVEDYRLNGEWTDLEMATVVIQLDNDILIGMPSIYSDQLGVFTPKEIDGFRKLLNPSEVSIGSITRFFARFKPKKFFIRDIEQQKITSILYYREEEYPTTGFIGLENGYWIHQGDMSPKGTGHACFWWFDSIEEIEERYGRDYYIKRAE